MTPHIFDIGFIGNYNLNNMASPDQVDNRPSHIILTFIARRPLRTGLAALLLFTFAAAYSRPLTPRESKVIPIATIIPPVRPELDHPNFDRVLRRALDIPVPTSTRTITEDFIKLMEDQRAVGLPQVDLTRYR